MTHHWRSRVHCRCRIQTQWACRPRHRQRQLNQSQSCGLPACETFLTQQHVIIMNIHTTRFTTFPCSDWSAGRVLTQLVSVDDRTNYKSQDQTVLKRYAILADKHNTNTCIPAPTQCLHLYCDIRYMTADKVSSLFTACRLLVETTIIKLTWLNLCVLCGLSVHVFAAFPFFMSVFLSVEDVPISTVATAHQNFGVDARFPISGELHCLTVRRASLTHR